LHFSCDLLSNSFQILKHVLVGTLVGILVAEFPAAHGWCIEIVMYIYDSRII